MQLPASDTTSGHVAFSNVTALNECFCLKKRDTKRQLLKKRGRKNFNKPGTMWFHWKFDPMDNPTDPIESLYIKHLVIVTIKTLKN